MYNLKVTREELLLLEALLGHVRNSDLDSLKESPDLYTRIYTKNAQIAAPMHASYPSIEAQHYADGRMQYIKHFTLLIRKTEGNL